MVLPGHRLALENKQAALLVVLCALGEGFLDDCAGREPRTGVAVKVSIELLANAIAGLVEFGILSCLSLGGIRWRRVVPLGVQTSDHGTKAKGALAKAFLETCSGDTSRVENRNTIVVGVEGFNKVLVQFLVNQINVGRVLGLSKALSNDGPAKVQEDKTGAGELCRTVGKGGCEAALMMIETTLLSVVLAANVDNSVAGSQDGRVAGADKRGITVGGEAAEHMDGEGLVSVEVAIVGANERTVARGLDALGC